MVDYPGRICAVVFTPHCNYDCFYCHNRQLLSQPKLMDSDHVFQFLEKRAGLLDALVISGGEPLMQLDLREFILDVRSLGYKIKLDTNGSYPDRLQDLLDEDLLDYVAIDLKAPFDRYPEICEGSGDGERVQESIEILKTCQTPYEVRTTFVPQLSVDEMAAAVELLAPIQRYSIQQYRVSDTVRERDRFKASKKPHLTAELHRLAEACTGYAKEIIVRA